MLILTALVPTTLLAKSSSAVPLPNGQTAFNSPPNLIKAASSYSSSNLPSTYFFTLKIPDNAGEPLKAVKIVQRKNRETIRYKGNATRAFRGNRWARGPQLSLAAIGGPTKPGEMMVVFDPPVQPGKTVTVALKAKQNPTFGGVYQFGVTAYPAGERSIGQFLGYGRLNFYSD
ncbi:DUF2808 domain-containing protein [Acaryochloris sp. CCMEE 5410]|uniref:DUF2808 domain-containing protein n=1 Tax=Acaryochloris sp. CCMEE 5410 TaxID=310037 RepID=UPI000681CC6E|nr:DUF2808 domain-containing protein [Acaryochloris sp. CCMEE 5410]